MSDLPALERPLGQRFILEQQIGAGGMGTVFRARDLLTGQKVAIKVLQAHGAPQEAERFAREAQLLAGLKHPHIVSYIADGLDDNGQPYLAMEWLEGEDLAKRLRQRRLTVSESASAWADTCHRSRPDVSSASSPSCALSRSRARITPRCRPRAAIPG